MTTVRDAYAECEVITRREARNFSYGIRLLPGPKRAALSAVYAMARRIDDVGDGSLPIDDKLAALAELRAQVARLPHDPFPGDPVLVALADAVTRFPIPLEALDDLVTGCEWDVKGTTYAGIDDLVAYCRLVAGSVGRLSLGVFGTDDAATATPLADDLGVALQLTNILRDIVEDHGMGRVYLPVEDLAAAGVAPDLEGALGTDSEAQAALASVVALEAERAEAWFGRGLQLLDHLDRRSRACTAAMAGIYHELLARIRRRPEAVLEGRLSLPGREKAWIALRSLAGATP